MFLDLLFPITCVNCGSSPHYLCSNCVNFLKPLDNQICPGCHKGSLFGRTHTFCIHKTHLQGLISTLHYNSLAKKLITKFKYKLVTSLLPEITNVISSFTDFSQFTTPLTLVPIPLHKRRLNERGFNQSLLLAQSLSAYLHWPINTDLLLRTKHTTPQMSLSRHDRLINLNGVFCLNQKLKIKEQSLMLVDDVYTTGATLNAAAAALKEVGFKTIWGFTLACS